MIMSSIQSCKIKGAAYIVVCLLGIGEASCSEDSANESAPKKGLLERGGRKIDKRVSDAKASIDEKKTQIGAAVGEAKDALEAKKAQAKERAVKARTSAGKALTNLRKGAKSKLNENCQAIVEQLRSQADTMETQCQKLDEE